MSFSWPTPSNSSLSGIKSSTTNSFADALKRLAEHVEEKNKNSKFLHSSFCFCFQSFCFFDETDTTNTNNGTSCTVTDPPNQINVPQTNHSAAPEQALRLYTQYIQEVFHQLKKSISIFIEFDSRWKDETIYDGIIFVITLQLLILFLTIPVDFYHLIYLVLFIHHYIYKRSINNNNNHK